MSDPKDHIFNSYIDPVPGIRPGIHIFEDENEGEKILGFHDDLGYATPHFGLPASAEQILSLVNGEYSIQQIMMYCSDEIKADDILRYVQFLDQNGILDSDCFRAHAEKMDLEYEQSGVHESNTAGISYSDDKASLEQYLNTMFEGFQAEKEFNKNPKALFAPHIDTRVGISSYVKAFSTIQHIKPKRVVMIGTSHYSGLFGQLYEYKPFIAVDKNFRMVNGEIESDSEFFDQLKSVVQEQNIEGISFDSRAHRIEHSLELHALMLNHIWDHEYKIVPFLVGSFEELMYMSNSSLEKDIDKAVKVLRTLINEEPDTFILVSGDLSHIGKKFGDQVAATDMIEQVNAFDQEFLGVAADGDENGLLSHMKSNFDAYRICGFSPLMTMIKAFPDLNGEIISYDIWDEKERESAVSFGSILYS